MVERPRACQVLNDMSQGFIDRDFRRGSPTDDSARENLADLSDNMRVVDHPRLFRPQELRSLAQHTFAAVGNEARSGNEFGIDFDRTRRARTDQIDMSPGAHPAAAQDGLAGRRDCADDISVTYHSLHGA